MDKSTSRHTHNKQSGRLTFTQRARQDQQKTGQTEWQTENVSHCVKVVHRGQTGALTDRSIDQLREKRKTYIQGDRTQTDEQTDRKTDGYTGRQTDRKADGQTDTQTDRQTDRKTGGQTDRQEVSWTDQQTGMQTLCLQREAVLFTSVKDDNCIELN